MFIAFVLHLVVNTRENRQQKCMQLNAEKVLDLLRSILGEVAEELEVLRWN